MLNFDDPGIAIALLAILVGLRVALFVVERLLVGRPAEAVVTALSPDDNPDVPPAPVLALPELPTADPHPYRFVTELLDSALIAVILVFFVIRPFVLQAFFIPSESMVPTLQKGDKLLATKYTFMLREPRHGEIIVFHAPANALQTLGQPYDAAHPTDYVKRVVGLPGDHIRIADNVGVFVNGIRQAEPYVAALPNYNFPNNADGTSALAYAQTRAQLQPYIVNNELVIPPGYVFVLGDNRQFSHDSHAWGLVPRKALVGKAEYLFWPPHRAGFVH
ncbi:MAG TPA: signal peptidase I [Armatimonadota bacterium]|jgi:signal peptidase I